MMMNSKKISMRNFESDEDGMAIGNDEFEQQEDKASHNRNYRAIEKSIGSQYQNSDVTVSDGQIVVMPHDRAKKPSGQMSNNEHFGIYSAYG